MSILVENSYSEFVDELWPLKSSRFRRLVGQTNTGHGLVIWNLYRSGVKHETEEDKNEKDHTRPTSTIKAGGGGILGILIDDGG